LGGNGFRAPARRRGYAPKMASVIQASSSSLHGVRLSQQWNDFGCFGDRVQVNLTEALGCWSPFRSRPLFDENVVVAGEPLPTLVFAEFAKLAESFEEVIPRRARGK
jgi:hypothetical protein